MNLKSSKTIGLARRTLANAMGAGDGVAKPSSSRKTSFDGAKSKSIDGVEKSSRPAGATKFAVSHDRKVQIFLHPDRIANHAILHLAKFFRGDLPASHARQAATSSGGRFKLPT